MIMEKVLVQFLFIGRNFFQEGILKKIENKVSDTIYAVYTNLENEGKNCDGQYSLIIVAEVNNFDNKPDNMVGTTVPIFKRSVFEVESGKPEKVGEKWQEIWANTDLERNFISDYESYGKSGKIEIFVGIK